MPVFTLNSNPHINTQGSSSSGTYNVGDTITLEANARRGYAFRMWEITGNGSTTIETNSEYIFYMPNYDVTVTSISALIEYNISYNDTGSEPLPTPNPEYYNIETPTFTLINPTKAGYRFIGWTGTNGWTPQLVVTIPQGSAGDRVYIANWEATSGGGIIINGQPLAKRIINGQEVQKVMYNGNQIRPTS